MRSSLYLCVIVSASAALLAGCSGGESQRPTITTTVIVTSPEGGNAVQPAPEKADGASSTDPAVGSAPADGNEPQHAPATAPGEITVTGTVVVRTAQELQAGRDIPDPFNPTDEFVILVLDQPVTVSGMRAGTAVTESVSQLSLGPASTNSHAFGTTYDHLGGQSVTVVFNAQKVSFPSDVRLPLGMPEIGNVITSIS